MSRTARFATVAVGSLGLALTLGACGATAPSADQGECISMAQMQEESGEEGVEDIPTVDCGDEHDAQVVYTYEVEGDEFPGEEALFEEAADECIPGFEDFVGSDFMESDLDVVPLTPSADSWDQANDREVLCIAFAMDGSTTTESWEGSGI